MSGHDIIPWVILFPREGIVLQKCILNNIIRIRTPLK